MGELALRSARDPAMAGIVRQTTDVWQATLRSLMADSRRDADALAALAVATLKGIYMLPTTTSPENRDKALKALEMTLGVAR